MKEGFKIPNQVEHLKEGARPILGAIGTVNDFVKSGDLSAENPHFGIENLQNVDWMHGTYKPNQVETLTAGPQTYIMSAIDDSNKYSETFRRCTGLLVVGVEKGTGKKISFLTHWDIMDLLYSRKDEITDHLRQRLEEMKDKCELGTVDAALFGGKYFSDDAEEDTFFQKNYEESVKLVGEEMEKVLGFEPTVVNGPKVYLGNKQEKDNLYFDNENRRFFFVRSKVNSDTRDFLPSEVDNQKNKWIN
jgi:hypothetical protein